MPRAEICETCHRPYTKRTDAQKGVMWSMLHDLAKQTTWHGQKLDEYEWKDLMTAGLSQQKVIPGLDGGFILCGFHTENMSKKEMSDLIDLIHMFGSQRGIKWTATLE